MLEKFSTQKTDSEIMREALTLRYYGGDIPTFLSKADKIYNQDKVGENVKFELLRDALKSDPMLFQFVLFRGSKKYEGIKESCLEYAENIKMLECSAAPLFQQTTKFDKDPKEDKIDEICKQVENLHLMMMKQPSQAPKQAEPVCYKCGKKDPYASQCRIAQEPTCYKCSKKSHRASECRSKVELPPTCTYCHQVGHTAENCFDKRSTEAVEKKDVRFAKSSEPTLAKGAGPFGQNNIMFVKEDKPVEEEKTVAAFKRTAEGETIIKQQRMQNDIDACTKTQVKQKISVRMNPDFPITRKVPKKNRKGIKESASKMVIAELEKRVEKYDFINNLAQAQAGITFGQIARGDIDFTKNELLKILSGKMGRAIVNFAGKDEVHGLSMSRHLMH